MTTSPLRSQGSDGLVTPGTTALASPLHEAPIVASTLFRHVIGHLAAGVTVITTAEGDELSGATASSVTSLSVDPPTLVCCLSRESSTGQAVARTRTFAVNILEAGQTDLAERFALGLPSAEKFVGVPLAPHPCGQPLLADALAYVVCRVREAIDGGTHFLFVSEVVHAETRPGQPLAYYRGAFGYFARDEDVSVRERLRNALLAGALESGEPLDLGELTAVLEAPATAVHYAVRELVGEGLVRRDPDRGYFVSSPEEQRADTARGRSVLELGALSGADRDGIAAIRTHVAAAEQAARQGDGRAAELHGAVHAAIAALGGSRALLQAHRHLAPAVLPPAARDELVALCELDRAALDAAAAGRLADAIAALRAHREREAAGRDPAR